MSDIADQLFQLSQTLIQSLEEQLSAEQKLELIPVEINDLETYHHPGGVFSIEIPVAWSKEDTSADNSYTVLWTDPAGNSIIGMDIMEVEAMPSQEELEHNLRGFIRESYGHHPNFEISAPQAQPDGSTGLEWAYEIVLEGKRATFWGYSLMQQAGNRLAVLSVLIPKDQFDSLQDNLMKIIISRNIEPGEL